MVLWWVSDFITNLLGFFFFSSLFLEGGFVLVTVLVVTKYQRVSARARMELAISQCKLHPGQFQYSPQS